MGCNISVVLNQDGDFEEKFCTNDVDCRPNRCVDGICVQGSPIPPPKPRPEVDASPPPDRQPPPERRRPIPEPPVETPPETRPDVTPPPKRCKLAQPVGQLGYTKYITEIAYNTDGTLFATSSFSDIKVWRLKDEKLLHTFSNQLGGVGGIAFSPNNKYFATGASRSVKVWDLQTGKVRYDFQTGAVGALDVKFSPDGNTVAAAIGDWTIRVWDLASGKQRFILSQDGDGHHGPVIEIAFNRDGSQLASVSKDTSLRIWNMTKGKLLTRIRQDGELLNVAFHPDRRTVAVVSQIIPPKSQYMHSIQIWDIVTQTRLHTLYGHEKPITSIDFNHKGNLLASTSVDNKIKLWDTKTWKVKRTIQGDGRWTGNVQFHPNDRVLAFANHRPRFWEVATGKSLPILQKVYNTHVAAVRALAFNKAQTRLLSVGDDAIKLWDLQTGHSLAEFKHPPNQRDIAHQIAWGHQEKTFLIRYNRALALWNLTTGKLLQRIELKNTLSNNSQLHIHPTQPIAFTNHSKAWTAFESQTLLQRYESKLFPSQHITLEPNGKRILAAGFVPTQNYQANFFDALTGKASPPFQIPTTSSTTGGRVWAVQIGPKSQEALFVTNDGNSKRWAVTGLKLATQTTTKQFQLHVKNSYNNRIAISPNLQRLVLSHLDPSELHVYSTQTGKKIQTFVGHEKSVNFIRYSPDSKRFATASSDETIRLWECPR